MSHEPIANHNNDGNLVISLRHVASKSYNNDF
jgi:hypothetical protein